MHRHDPRGRRRATIGALLIATALAALACTPASGLPTATPEATTSTEAALFDGATVHEITVSFDQAAYESMIATYLATDVKAWIEATVTIDGTTYERVGMRLKGNSSLRALDSAQGGGPSGDLSSEQPVTLPWLIRLDEFVDGQSHDGTVEFVVRSNTTETALNEAVALELLDLAGLASQDAAAARLSVNGSEQVLRLVIEHPDDGWMTASFGGSGALYKAESGGDYGYRGDDPAGYDEVFDQEAGKDNADLAPLIDFLAFINESDDDTFAADIATRLDVDGFATYLAMQTLLDNFDDIDGPGNNSYLYYDLETERFTVVPWDYNLAFGVGPGGAGGGGMPRGDPPGDGARPPADGDMQPPGGGQGGGGGFGGGFGGGSNVLSQRFLAIADYAELVDQRVVELTASLFDSGTAATVLADWVAVLTSQAADLVDAATVDAEAASIRSVIESR